MGGAVLSTVTFSASSKFLSLHLSATPHHYLVNPIKASSLGNSSGAAKVPSGTNQPTQLPLLESLPHKRVHASCPRSSPHLSSWRSTSTSTTYCCCKGKALRQKRADQTEHLSPITSILQSPSSQVPPPKLFSVRSALAS